MIDHRVSEECNQLFALLWICVIIDAFSAVFDETVVVTFFLPLCICLDDNNSSRNERLSTDELLGIAG